MAKMTRNSLKSLVKECLFEILLEATEDNNASRINESRKRRKPAKKSMRPALDNMVVGKGKAQAAPPKIDVSGLTSDPVMAAIFQDTASTTLVEQHAAEGRPAASGGDTASRIVAQSDPSELFGSASQNWAALAFDE